MTDQIPSKECDQAFVKLVGLLQTSAYTAGASGGYDGVGTMREAGEAIIESYARLERKLDTCGLQCSTTLKSLVAENERAFELGWRTAARWVDRDDLIADIGSPAYEADRAKALGERP